MRFVEAAGSTLKDHLISLLLPPNNASLASHVFSAQRLGFRTQHLELRRNRKRPRRSLEFTYRVVHEYWAGAVDLFTIGNAAEDQHPRSRAHRLFSSARAAPPIPGTATAGAVKHPSMNQRDQLSSREREIAFKPSWGQRMH